MNTKFKKSTIFLAISSALGTAHAGCPVGTQPPDFDPATNTYPTVTAAQFSTMDTGFTPAPGSQEVVHLNNTGGTGTNDLRITVDRSSRMQVKFNNKNQFFVGSDLSEANDLTSQDTDEVYNEFGFYYQGHGFGNTGRGYYGPKNTSIDSVWSDSLGQENDFRNLGFSELKGDGSAATPYQVRLQYYADLNDNQTYDPNDDIIVTEIYTYRNNEKFFRRDRKIVKGSNVTGALIPFDARDVVFNANSDAGDGIYSLTGLTAVLPGDNAVHTDATIVGVKGQGGGGEL